MPSEVGGIKIESTYGVFPFTYIFNMTGHPAASAPCGFVDGLPVGMQIPTRLRLRSGQAVLRSFEGELWVRTIFVDAIEIPTHSTALRAGCASLFETTGDDNSK